MYSVIVVDIAYWYFNVLIWLYISKDYLNCGLIGKQIHLIEPNTPAGCSIFGDDNQDQGHMQSMSLHSEEKMKTTA